MAIGAPRLNSFTLPEGMRVHTASANRHMMDALFASIDEGVASNITQSALSVADAEAAVAALDPL